MEKKVLIVEDCPDWREILAFYLRQMGYQVFEADNGERAIKTALEESPDVIVLDLGLPDVSGVEVAAILKQDPKTRHIPIVAHTAWPPEIWKEKAFKAGVSDYLTKPTPPGVLKEAIEKVIAQFGPATSGSRIHGG